MPRGLTVALFRDPPRLQRSSTGYVRTSKCFFPLLSLHFMCTSCNYTELEPLPQEASFQEADDNHIALLWQWSQRSGAVVISKTFV